MSVVQFREDGNGYSNSINALNFWTSVGDSIAGTATRCGLESPGCESRWGKKRLPLFYTLPDRPWHLPASYSVGLLDPEYNISLRNVGNQSTEHNILEDLNLHQHCCENLIYHKSQIVKKQITISNWFSVNSKLCL